MKNPVFEANSTDASVRITVSDASGVDSKDVTFEVFDLDALIAFCSEAQQAAAFVNQKKRATELRSVSSEKFIKK